ncbi:MAG: hypothetical protein ACOCQD_03650 [archaeon]
MSYYTVVDENGNILEIDTMLELASYISKHNNAVLVDFSGTHDMIMVTPVSDEVAEEHIDFDFAWDEEEEE